MTLRERDESGWDLPNFAVRRAASACGGALVAALLAYVDDIASLGTLLGAPVVRSPEIVKRWRLGSEVRTAFLGQRRAAHSRHPRQ